MKYFYILLFIICNNVYAQSELITYEPISLQALKSAGHQVVGEYKILSIKYEKQSNGFSFKAKAVTTKSWYGSKDGEEIEFIFDYNILKMHSKWYKEPFFVGKTYLLVLWGKEDVLMLAPASYAVIYEDIPEWWPSGRVKIDYKDRKRVFISSRSIGSDFEKGLINKKTYREKMRLLTSDKNLLDFLETRALASIKSQGVEAVISFPSYIKLKPLIVGEKIIVEKSYFNNTDKEIYIPHLKSKCQCVRKLKVDKRNIKPGEKVTLSFEFKAGDKPGKYSKEIFINYGHVSRLEQTIKVYVEVLPEDE